ncbi:MAG: hypothetical protein V4714_02080 [Bacteroidota bacterium]
MATLTKEKKPTLSADKLILLHEFAKKVIAGEIQPSKDKVQQARQNLQKAGLVE